LSKFDSYYKVSGVKEVLKYLSSEQKKELYAGNIYLAIKEYTDNNRNIKKKGVLIVYNLYRDQFTRFVRKAIPELLEWSEEVSCLPKDLAEKVNNDFDNWAFGKTTEKIYKDGVKVLTHTSYYLNSGCKKGKEGKNLREIECCHRTQQPLKFINEKQNTLLYYLPECSHCKNPKLVILTLENVKIYTGKKAESQINKQLDKEKYKRLKYTEKYTILQGGLCSGVSAGRKYDIEEYEVEHKLKNSLYPEQNRAGQ